MEVLEIKDLRKSYKENAEVLTILKGVNLTVKAGEMIAVSGESGCGKSTLLHLLGLLDSSDSGEIYYNGNKIDPNDKEISRFRNKTIGFVFQSHYLLEDFTAEENAAMPAIIASGKIQESKKKARALLDKLGVLARKDHYPNQLSGGEQQRVAFARALINNPQIVLADEPTGNLDPKHSDELLELILKMNREYNQTFIIVTHDPEIAARMDRSFILVDGLLQPAGL